MSEWNTIYNNSKNIVGTFRHGQAFGRNPDRKLGSYNELCVFDIDGAQIAKIGNNSVHAMDGTLLGEWEYKPNEHYPKLNSGNKRLIVHGKVIGECLGLNEAAAAAIVLLSNELLASSS